MKAGRPLFLVPCLLALPLLAQTGAQTGVQSGAQPPAPVRYDVSTVRPSNDLTHGMSMNPNGGALEVKSGTLLWLVMSAFDVRDDQIEGLPSWGHDLHWDINAKLTDIDKEAAAKLTGDQKDTLMRALLAERFGLKSHVETRVMPTYDLVAAKGGVRLPATDPAKTMPGLCPGCFMTAQNSIRGQAIPVANLVEALGSRLQRNVTNRTGLADDRKVDVDLHFAPETGAVSSGDSAAPPLQTALEEQLGLKLVATRGPVTVLVIDHVEKPADN